MKILTFCLALLMICGSSMAQTNNNTYPVRYYWNATNPADPLNGTIVAPTNIASANPNLGGGQANTNALTLAQSNRLANAIIIGNTTTNIGTLNIFGNINAGGGISAGGNILSGAAMSATTFAGDVSATYNYQATNLVGIVRTNNLPLAQLGGGNGSASNAQPPSLNLTNWSNLGTNVLSSFLLAQTYNSAFGTFTTNSFGALAWKSSVTSNDFSGLLGYGQLTGLPAWLTVATSNNISGQLNYGQIDGVPAFITSASSVTNDGTLLRTTGSGSGLTGLNGTNLVGSLTNSTTGNANTATYAAASGTATNAASGGNIVTNNQLVVNFPVSITTSNLEVEDINADVIWSIYEDAANDLFITSAAYGGNIIFDPASSISGNGSGLTGIKSATNAIYATMATNNPFVLSPMQFGAAGNGVTDDSTAWLGCVAYANSNAFFIRRIDGNRKTYSINSTLPLTNFDMELFNAKIVTTNKALVNLVWCAGDRAKLHDLWLGGPGTNYLVGSSGVLFSNLAAPYIQQPSLVNVKVTNFWYDVHSWFSVELRISQCQLTAAGSNDVFLDHCDESIIESSAFGSADITPRDMADSGTATLTALTNSIAIRCNSGLGSTIRNNDINYCGQAIVIDGQGNPTEGFFVVEKNNIEAMFANNAPQLVLTNANAIVEGNIFDGDLFSGTTNACIGVYNPANAQNVFIGLNKYNLSVPIDVYVTGDSPAGGLPLCMGYPTDNSAFQEQLVLYHTTWNDAGAWYPATIPNWAANPVISGRPTFTNGFVVPSASLAPAYFGSGSGYQLEMGTYDGNPANGYLKVYAGTVDLFAGTGGGFTLYNQSFAVLFQVDSVGNVNATRFTGTLSGNLTINSNAWSVATATNGMPNFSSLITSSNGVPVVIYKSNNVPFIYYLSPPGGGMLGTVGLATLVGGTNKVSTSAFDTNRLPQLVYLSDDGMVANIALRSAGWSQGSYFTIYSSNSVDTNRVQWTIIP
jgi:hypothetical protein